MIRHIVFWKINPDYDQEKFRFVVENFDKKTKYLKTIIPEIIEAKVGVNLFENSDYDLCIDSTFSSIEDLNKYISHPEHLKVRAFLNEHTTLKTVFDYSLTEN